jgi:hypothetical protein
MININNSTILVGKDYVYLLSNKGLTELKNVHDLKKHIPNGKINLITAPDLSHFNIVESSNKDKITKDKIKNELQKLVPTNLDTTTWAYEELTKSKKTTSFWTFVTEDHLLKPFVKSLESNKIIIDGVSSLTWLINRQVVKSKSPVLLIFIKKKIKFLALLNDEQILTYDLGDLSNFKEDIVSLLEYGKNEHNIETKKIIAISDRDLSNLKLEIDPHDFSFKNLKFQELIDDYKIDTTTKITSPHPEEPFIPFESKESETAEVVKSNLPRLLIMLVLSLGLMSLTVGQKLFSQDQPRSTKPPEVEQAIKDIVTVPIIEPSPSPEPTFYPALYSIEVLNGTSQGGIATETKELLEENGFEDVAVGNAEQRDYQLTQIITDNDPELTQQIIDIIGDSYEIDNESTRGSLSEDFDATIILGIKK